MQMLCKVANSFSDVRCPVCGQGFMVYWTRVQARQREEHRAGLLEGLRQQHTSIATAEAHPSAFHLADTLTPALHGDPATLAMPALLGVYS